MAKRLVKTGGRQRYAEFGEFEKNMSKYLVGESAWQSISHWTTPANCRKLPFLRGYCASNQSLTFIEQLSYNHWHGFICPSANVDQPDGTGTSRRKPRRTEAGWSRDATRLLHTETKGRGICSSRATPQRSNHQITEDSAYVRMRAGLLLLSVPRWTRLSPRDIQAGWIRERLHGIESARHRRRNVFEFGHRGRRDTNRR